MKTRQITLKIAALILGLVLWVYANLVVPPMLRRNVNVTVTYRNLPTLLKVSPTNPVVEVSLSGTRRDFILAGNEPASAFIDLVDLQPGGAVFQTRVITQPGLNVVSIRPTQIEISAERLIRKEIEITPEVQGRPADGFIHEPVMIRPSKVAIEGPREIVESITACFVTVNLFDITNSISEKKTVQLLAGKEAATENIRVIPDKVDVSVTIKKGYPSKTVPIASPTLINQLQEGSRLADHSFHPAETKISGPFSLIQNITIIGPLPVDLATLSNVSSLTVPLVAPAERIDFVGPSSITVSLSIKPVEITRSFRDLQLTIQKSTNQHCILSISSYTLVLQGFVEDINRVFPANLAIVLDTREMAPGNYTVILPTPTGLPEGITVIGTQPETAEIAISEISQSENRPSNNISDNE